MATGDKLVKLDGLKAVNDYVQGQIGDLTIALLLQEETIPDTVQSITFDSAGNVTQIIHEDEEENAVRTDVFTFSENTITEVRTLSTGESLTIETNTTTLVTSVIYAAA